MLFGGLNGGNFIAHGKERVEQKQEKEKEKEQLPNGRNFFFRWKTPVATGFVFFVESSFFFFFWKIDFSLYLNETFTFQTSFHQKKQNNW